MTAQAEKYDLVLAVKDNAEPEADRLEQEAVSLEAKAAANRDRAGVLRALARVVGP